METLDLHGVRHHKVHLLVEDFVLRSDLPARIITGNSPAMKSIVEEVLRQYNLVSDFENDWNLGSIIVKER
jgi:DNA-nicking Smr family endonuclease